MSSAEMGLTANGGPVRCAGQLSLREAQGIVKDLGRPRPWIYWADFLLTILSGHALFHVVLFAPNILAGPPWWMWCQRAVLFGAMLVLYMRAAMFTHELVHLPKQGFRGFRIAWNLLCGIPFMIPSFMYYPHVDHHRRKSYGTHEDGEYVSLSHRPRFYIIGYLLSAVVVPPLGFLRFLVMAPLSWIWPGLRKWTYRHASTMVMDPLYERQASGWSTARIMRMQEVACFLFCVAMILRGPLLHGVWLDGFWVQAYLVGVCMIVMNNVRTLGAHRWTGAGEELTFEEQLLDSVNYPHRPWITELWGPIGTRYHALHHLFPSIPYHNLGIAHRRLTAQLPADSPYHQTVRVSLSQAIAELWSRAGEISAASAGGGSERSTIGSAA